MDGAQRRIARDQYVRKLVEPPAGGAPYLLVSFTEDMAELRSPTGDRAAVLTAAAGAGAEEVGRRARALLAAARERTFQLVVIGGGDDVRRAVKRAVPSFTFRERHALHLADDRTARRFGPFGYEAAAVEPSLTRPFEPAEIERLLEEGRRTEEPRQAQQEEERRWASFLGRLPAATGLIGLASIAMALAADHWSGDKIGPVLSSLGAYGASEAQSGEWWRLFSATLLHRDAVTAVFTVNVLFQVGRLVERILGSSRFLLLYVVSGVAASLADARWGGDGVGAGGAGAIWGCAGGLLAIAWRLRSVLPPDKLRWISWGDPRPFAEVLWLAFGALCALWHVHHAVLFIGLATGFALVASGILAQGLPASKIEDPEALRPRRYRGWQALAALCALLVAGSVAAAIAAKPPWEVRPLRHELGDSGLTIELPRLHRAPVSSSERPRTFEFGDPERDPIWGTVHFDARPTDSPGSCSAPPTTQMLQEHFAAISHERPDGAAKFGPVRLRSVGGRRRSWRTSRWRRGFAGAATSSSLDAGSST